MIILLSPAKTLDFNAHNKNLHSSETRFDDKSQQLINKLSRSSIKGLRELMHISKDLAVLNKERYEAFDIEKIEERGKEAILAFNGGVYQGLDAETLPEDAFDYAQDHVRILSGLYGVLRPLDKIQEYRLEMGIKLPIRRKKNLYEFWGEQPTQALNQDLEKIDSKIIFNAASNEYFKVVDKKKINAQIIDVDFREMHKGELKFISFNAKKARGLITRFAIDNNILDYKEMRAFNFEDYQYNKSLSSDTKFVFTR
jgi:cytoplasmic iron level regulating protein YaaA (DUF328/UPF0246 family)